MTQFTPRTLFTLLSLRTALIRRSALPALALVLAGPASAQLGTGVDWLGTVYSINLVTGSTTVVGSSGLGEHNSLAAAPGGVLYSVATGGNELVTIDPATGAASLVGNVGLDDVRALAYDPLSGLLFAVRDANVLPNAFDGLATIDPVSLMTQNVGSTLRSGLQGLAFAPDGTLYGWDVGNGVNGPGLVRLDPATGVGTVVAPGLGNGSNHQFMTFTPDGTCLVGRSSLFAVDLVTGVTTLVTSTGAGDLRGFDFPVLPIGTGTCAAATNSSGLAALLTASGSTQIAANYVRFQVTQLPADQFGYFVMGRSLGLTAVGQGTLCVALPFLRFNTDILDSGSGGQMAFQPDLTALPQGTAVLSGESWHFQCWYRDDNPGPTSNLSNGLELVFQ